MRTRRLAVLGSVVAACLLLLTLQARGLTSAAGDVVTLVTTPVHKAFAVAHQSAVGLWSGYLDWKNTRADNRRLREEVRELRVEALAATEIADENRRLRQLLDLRSRLPIETKPSLVIAREWGGWVRSITVDRGRGDAIRPLTAVITPDGLVGRVVDVRPGASVIQVLTDPASTVGAHALGTRTPGIAEGDSRGALRFKYMARDGQGLAVGDLVVTSGVGGVIPRGIPIGRVSGVEDRGSTLFRYALLSPAVDFSSLDEVLLVVGDATRDVTRHFAAGG